ncbi:hypothetical protein ACF0H5_008380 [Mactra antiquata]
MNFYSLFTLSVYFIVSIAHQQILAQSLGYNDKSNHGNVGELKPVQEEGMRQRIIELETEVAKLQQENKMIIDLLHELKLSNNARKLKAQEVEFDSSKRASNNQGPKGMENNVRSDYVSNHYNTIQDPLPRGATSILRRKRRDAVVGGIAFTAYLTATNSNMVPGQAIKFDQVILNDGQGYNQYTGAFTAPVTGTYLFTFYFDTRKLTFVRLVLNGVNEVDAVANPHTNADSRQSQSMGGNAAVLHVLKGQAVLVETYEINSSEVASSNTFRLCSFSGVLLY